MAYAKLSAEHERVGKIVVNSAYTVHSQLGPGLLESVYEVCLKHELQKRGVIVERQVKVPIEYDGLSFDEGFRIDLLVENLVICELKAVKEVHPVFQAQTLSYMKLTNIRLGYLINFHVPRIKDGIQRFIL